MLGVIGRTKSGLTPDLSHPLRARVERRLVWFRRNSPDGRDMTLVWRIHTETLYLETHHSHVGADNVIYSRRHCI